MPHLHIYPAHEILFFAILGTFGVVMGYKILKRICIIRQI
jgi:hypothetical protein